MDALPAPVLAFAEQYPFLLEYFPLFLHALAFAWEHPYLCVGGLLLLSGLGLPLPEEVSLLLGGYLVYWKMDCPEDPPFWPAPLANMVLVCCLSILAGDLVVYALGRRFGEALLAHRYARWILSKQNHGRITGFYDRWGHWAVFLSRFVAGIRVGSFLLAGSSKVKLRTFFLMDALGTLISGPVSVWLAYRLGGEIGRAIVTVGRVFENMIYAVALAALLGIWWQIRRARRASARGTSSG